MCLDWHGTAPTQRGAAAGATLTDASLPATSGTSPER